MARDKAVRTLGLWSAPLCTLFSLVYVLAQLAEWAGLLGSADGPHVLLTDLHRQARPPARGERGP